MIIFFRIKFFR